MDDSTSQDEIMFIGKNVVKNHNGPVCVAQEVLGKGIGVMPSDEVMYDMVEKVPPDGYIQVHKRAIYRLIDNGYNLDCAIEDDFMVLTIV